jgi:hypothetical protein
MSCRLVHFLDELQQLLALAIAEIEESDSDIERIVDCLGYAAEAKRQSLNAELDFDPAKDAQRKSLLGANSAASKTDIDDVSVHVSGQANEANHCRIVERESALDDPLPAGTRGGPNALIRGALRMILVFRMVCHERNSTS